MARAKATTSAAPVARASALGSLGVCGYLIGIALPISPPVDVPLLFLVLLATLAAVSGARQARAFDWVAIVPAAVFVAARVVSSLGASDALRGLPTLAPLLPALLLFFVLSEWVRVRHHLVAVCLSLTAAGFALAGTLLVVSRLSANPDAEAWAQAVPSPMLVVKNDITVAAVLAPLALAAARLRPGRLVWSTVAAYFAALVAAIGLVQSRTALVTLVVAVAAFAAFGGLGTTRRPRLVILIACLVIVVLAAAALGLGLAHKIGHDWQGNGRLALWAAALAMFRDAPWVGHGPNSFGLHYRAYLEALQLPPWIRVDPRVTPWAHNLYLELLAEQGLVGLLAFLGLGAAGASMVRGLRRSADGELRHLGVAAGAALIAFLAAASFELTFLRAWVTIILFTLLGLLTTLSRSARGSTP